MSEQELVSEIEEVEVAVAEAAEEVEAAEQLAEEATEVVEAAEEVDALEEFKSKLRRQVGDWYVVHTYSGYENKVKTGIETRIQNLEAEDEIFEVQVPMETVVEFKTAKAIGLSGSETYAVLVTLTPWQDASGGYPKQVCVHGDTMWWRFGTSDVSWGGWWSVLDSASTNTAWLIAHRVGEYIETDGSFNPNSIGGTWKQVPSVGPYTWLRTK